MPEPAVLYDTQKRVGILTLNRPENRNSMTEDVLTAFAAGVETAKRDGAIRALVITGKGNCFCAGADLKAGAQRTVEGRTLLPNERSFGMYEPFLALQEIEVPIIGALNGHAVGGGLGLAMMCDLRVIAQDAKIGANFTRLGLHPGMALTYLLPRIVGVARANELLLTGRLITGAEAAEIGLVNSAVERAAVWDEAWALAEACASAAPIATRWTKRSIYRHLDWQPTPAAEYEAGLQSRTLDTDDHAEGAAALLEKRDPSFSGS